MGLPKWEVVLIDVRRRHSWLCMELSICKVVVDDGYDSENTTVMKH